MVQVCADNQPRIAYDIGTDRVVARESFDPGVEEPATCLPTEAWDPGPRCRPCFRVCVRKPKAKGGGEPGRSASRHQAQEPAGNRADARGGAGRRQGTRSGSADGRCPECPPPRWTRLSPRFSREHDAIPLFLGYPSSVKGKPAFPAVICASVNEQVVHGIPNRRPLREGDIVSVDTGCKVNGWCGDAAVTLAIGTVRPEIQKLLDVTSETLNLAIRAMARCGTWLEVASLMERFVKSQGLYVVEKFVGHGIGQTMHEEPQVPNFVSKSLRQIRHQARAGRGAGHRADGRPGDQRSPYSRRRLDRRDQGSTLSVPTSSIPWR